MKVNKSLVFYGFLVIRVLVMGMPTGCCKKITAKIHVDGIFDNLANNCPDLRRLEIGWDSETLRFSDKSSKVSDRRSKRYEPCYTYQIVL